MPFFLFKTPTVYRSCCSKGAKLKKTWMEKGWVQTLDGIWGLRALILCKLSKTQLEGAAEI